MMRWSVLDWVLFLRFLRGVVHAYLDAETAPRYWGETRQGICCCAFFLARGREAWMAREWAIESGLIDLRKEAASE